MGNQLPSINTKLCGTSTSSKHSYKINYWHYVLRVPGTIHQGLPSLSHREIPNPEKDTVNSPSWRETFYCNYWSRDFTQVWGSLLLTHNYPTNSHRLDKRERNGEDTFFGWLEDWPCQTIPRNLVVSTLPSQNLCWVHHHPGLNMAASRKLEPKSKIP